MRGFSIVVAIGLAGCITHDVSRLGPFVKNISVQPQTLVVDSCVVQYETTTNYTWLWFGEDATTDHELTEGQCWRQALPVGDVP